MYNKALEFVRFALGMRRTTPQFKRYMEMKS